MIRSLILALCLVPLLFLLCCSSEKGTPTAFEAWMEQNGKVKVLSTTSMIDDLVSKIGGERIDHLALITGEIDPHSYELVKGDDEKFSFATVVFYNGLGLEHGASLRYRLQKHAFSVALGDAVIKKHPDKIIHVDEVVDPHLWLDISLWLETIDPIVEALSKADPEAGDLYRKNGEELKQELQKAHEKIFSRLQQIPSEKRYLVTSHDAFNYFTRAYLASPDERNDRQWQKRFAAPEGLAPEGQLSAVDIQQIIDHLATFQIGTIFAESNVSKDSLRKILNVCAKKGMQVQLSNQVLYGDAMGSSESGARGYLDMLEHNVDVLEEAWK